MVFHGVGDIRLDEVPEPTIQEPTDAIVRLTSSAICGTDLHIIRGTLAEMREGTILGHGGVGGIEEVGPRVRNLNPGDRVVVGSTVGCGNCNHRRYIPKLVGLVATGALDPTEILTQREPATGAIEAYEAFDQRQPGWIKVELLP